MDNEMCERRSISPGYIAKEAAPPKPRKENYYRIIKGK